jgi:hypothetical protein
MIFVAELPVHVDTRDASLWTGRVGKALPVADEEASLRREGTLAQRARETRNPFSTC